MNTVKPMKPLTALNLLNEIATSFLVSQAFFAACNLGLFEQLSQEPATAETLGRKLNIHPEGCRRLLVALAQTGLVEREEERYAIRSWPVSDFAIASCVGTAGDLGRSFLLLVEFPARRAARIRPALATGSWRRNAIGRFSVAPKARRHSWRSTQPIEKRSFPITA